MKKRGLVIGFAVGLTLGLLFSPVLARSGRNKWQEWDKKFFEPLRWTMMQIEARYVEEVDPQRALTGAYQGILSKLDDYSSYIPPKMLEEFRADTKGEFGGLGIQIRFLPVEKILRVEQPIPGTPAFKLGVLAGDIITKIREGDDGEVIETSTFEDVHDAVRILRGEPNTDVTITIIHKDTRKEEEITITRAIIKVPGIRAVRMVDEAQKIGYIYVAYFHEGTVENTDAAIKELKQQGLRALVIDLRFNPGGLLESTVQMSDRFLTDGVIVSTRERGDKERFRRAEDGDVLDGAPIVVLVNRYSASASEILAGAIKDNRRGIVVGETTYGKGTVQSIIALKNKQGALKLTTARYYTPSGVCIEKTGIKPDIEIKLTDEQTRALVQHLADANEYPPAPEEESDKRGLEAAPKPEGETDKEDKKEPFRDVQLERAVDILTGILLQQGRLGKNMPARAAAK